MNNIEVFIKENYLSMSQREMSEVLNISKSMVEYYMRKNNLTKRKELFSDSDIQFMKDNYLKMEYKEIASHLNLTERQVRGKINHLGLTKERKFNKEYFAKIDNPIKAYYIGLIFADGWIVHNECTRNYELGISLQSQDKYILDKLNDEIGGVHKIYHINPKSKTINGVDTISGDQDVLRIYSKNIVEDLIKLGITENKSHNDNYPAIQQEFFYDFLRGYIDGDGCYYCHQNKLNMNITCSSMIVLQYIQQRLLDDGIVTSVYKEKEYKCRLICCKRDSILLLLDKIYNVENTIFLKRKYDIVKSFIGSSA